MFLRPRSRESVISHQESQGTAFVKAFVNLVISFAILPSFSVVTFGGSSAELNY